MQLLSMLLASAILSAGGGQLPQVVRNGLDARDVERTAHITWTLDSREGDAAVTEHYVTQVSGDTIYQVNNGDESGFHLRNYQRAQQFLEDVKPYGQTIEMHRFKYAEPQHTLLESGQVWKRGGSGHIVGLRDVGTPYADAPFDFLQAGAWPVPRTDRPVSRLPTAWNEGWDAAEYTTTTAGSVETVTAKRDRLTMTWDIDVSRGRQPVRVSINKDGKPLYWSRTRLSEQNGRWFPSAVEFFSSRKMDGAEPYEVVKVQEASFDEPWHWHEPFTPNDINIGLGIQISGDRFWDGTQLISRQECMDLVHLYEVAEHPDAVAKHAEFMHKTPAEYLDWMKKGRKTYLARYAKKHGHPFEPPTVVATDEDAWDIYVRKFIADHQLRDKREEHALGFLKRCKKLRTHHLHKHRKAIRKAELSNDADELERLNEQVKRIFERLLKPGLMRLLTRSERASLRHR